MSRSPLKSFCSFKNRTTASTTPLNEGVIRNTETALSSEWSISQAFKSASASHSFFLPLPLSLSKPLMSRLGICYSRFCLDQSGFKLALSSILELAGKFKICTLTASLDSQAPSLLASNVQLKLNHADEERPRAIPS